MSSQVWLLLLKKNDDDSTSISRGQGGWELLFLTTVRVMCDVTWPAGSLGSAFKPLNDGTVAVDYRVSPDRTLAASSPLDPAPCHVVAAQETK